MNRFIKYDLPVKQSRHIIINEKLILDTSGTYTRILNVLLRYDLAVLVSCNSVESKYKIDFDEVEEFLKHNVFRNGGTKMMLVLDEWETALEKLK